MFGEKQSLLDSHGDQLANVTILISQMDGFISGSPR